ncbi:hypothetical protein Scep_017992 [Stephania cephalantha]|uniref:Activator of basal transcription 1 n=1 Tax=Stephania cephalantha TaxID=152367 RepID=A0AAP0IQM7_9MAGN
MTEKELDEPCPSMDEATLNVEADVAKSQGRNKRKSLLLKEAAVADKRGVCYLSRVPPHMNPFKLQQILSQYGEIQRIYLTPENPVAQAHRKQAGKFRGQEFSEGCVYSDSKHYDFLVPWVEFAKKSVAKKVANMLNGEQIGGRKRSSFYYDLWNIKYLSKFKWDNLTEELAYKKAIRDQKLALEISAAKRERDFYLSKVDKSHALTNIEKKRKKLFRLKKQKINNDVAGVTSDTQIEEHQSKVVRQFPQKQPVADVSAMNKPRLSKDILAGVFGASMSS